MLNQHNIDPYEAGHQFVQILAMSFACGLLSCAGVLSWESTVQSYLDRGPKAQFVQALRDAGHDLVDDGVASMKKDVVVIEAASRLAGKRWLLVSLRNPPG